MPVTAEFFFELADAAARETLPRFRDHGAISDKGTVGGLKAYDPVTLADQAAELAIRALIEKRFPDHGILGEEHGAVGTDRRHVWVIDPIDGTRAFITGIPVWGTLVGLTDGGKSIAGMMAQPFTGELFYALDGKSVRRSAAGEAPNKVSGVTGLAEATLFTTTPHLFRGEACASAMMLGREQGEAFPLWLRLLRLLHVGSGGFVDLCHRDCAASPMTLFALVPIIERCGRHCDQLGWLPRPGRRAGNIIA